MGTLLIKQIGNIRMARTVDGTYNYRYDVSSGHFMRWGKTVNDDPVMAPVPEILDIEVTDICKGPGGKLCPFCYKANTPMGTYMPFETFATIIDRMPWLTQIALGVDAQGTSNPDLPQMMEYARSKGIVPNLTVADIDDKIADMIATYAGACAVSRYDDKNYCYDSIKKLEKAFLKKKIWVKKK